MTASQRDEAQTPFHPSIGCPGETVIYLAHDLHTLHHVAPSTGTINASESQKEEAPRISVTVPPASIHNIFAHRQWRAGMLLADLIYSTAQQADSADENARSRLFLDVRGKRVLELGAGTGLPGIMAAQEQGMSEEDHSQTSPRAKQVVISDYDEEELITRLKANVKANTSHCAVKTASVGHIWGQDPSDLLDILAPSPCAASPKFDVILLADCLWDRLSHAALLKTLRATLSRTSEARAYVASGLHTGRETLVSFIVRAQREGFVVKPWLRCDEEGGFQVVSEIGDIGEEGEDEDWTRHLVEVQLTSIDAEQDSAKQENSSALVSRGPRVTTHARPFVTGERPEENKEVGGVQQRNKWMTLWSLGWRQGIDGE